MNGAEAFVARLEAHGVDTIFGLPGEENLAFVEALSSSSIELVVTRHEQHAAFMAAAHGRLTGRPGVCLATLGPGALNLFTGLAHAELGGMPVLAITGQKPRRDNDEGSFQIVDIVSAARPVTRWAVSVTDPRNITATVDEALAQATSGRPGAVLVELPEDVAAEEVDVVAAPRSSTSRDLADRSALAAAAETIDRARRVVVLAGSGSSNIASSTAIREFAEATGVGVLATQMGKGSIAESHPLSYRSLGIHRPDYSHLAIDAVDLVIAIGYQPVEHPPLAWNPDEDKSIIHIAPWAAAIERGYQPEHQLVGDIPATLQGLAERFVGRDPSEVADVRRVIEKLLSDEEAGAEFPPSPLGIVRTVRAALGDRDIVALDNGAYKIWFARHYPALAPDTLLLDNALATMGAGLATAMAAARLTDERVVAVCGDGGFLMNVQDLETACRLQLDLTVLVVRDDAYGFIGWHQEEQGRDRAGVELGNPDLEMLGRAFGASTHRVTVENGLSSALNLALSEPGVSLIDCPVDYSLNDLLETDLFAKATAALDGS